MATTLDDGARRALAELVGEVRTPPRDYQQRPTVCRGCGGPLVEVQASHFFEDWPANVPDPRLYVHARPWQWDDRPHSAAPVTRDQARKLKLRLT